MAKPIGQVLLEKKLVTPEQLERALAEQGKVQGFLGEILVGMGVVSEEQVLRAISAARDIPFVNLKEVAVDETAIRAVPVRVVQHYKTMPIRLDGKVLVVAMSNPYAKQSLGDLGLHLGREVRAVLACQGQITEAIDKYYGVGAETIERLSAKKQDEARLGGAPPRVEEATEDIAHRADDASVIQLVNQILHEAIQQRASDIHIEPDRHELQLRYRVDGALYDTRVAPEIRHLFDAIISRIKIMAKLDIAEKRMPKDGRIRIRVGDKELDLRVSIMPSVHGENVVIRILPTQMLLSLDRLGLSDHDRAALESVIRKPYGIVVVTGPTGSGKTTTLYTCLSQLNARDKKIITVEDPVEYELRGITQLQVNPKVNVTFATALRSILRHDPDIIMVGEIRDPETAEIAVQAALTGHIVFTTLHTNDAASGIARLMHMGIQPYLIASSAVAFLAQRLVRVICPGCKEQVTETRPDLLPQGAPTAVFRGKGCEACRFTGYKGRSGIYEILPVGERIRELILERAPSDVVKREAIRLGMTTLYRDGLEKIAQGVTTPEELMATMQADS